MDGICLTQEIKVEENLHRGSWAYCCITMQRCDSKPGKVNLHLTIKPIGRNDENVEPNVPINTTVECVELALGPSESPKSALELLAEVAAHAAPSPIAEAASAIATLANIAHLYYALMPRPYHSYPLLLCDSSDLLATRLHSVIANQKEETAGSKRQRKVVEV